MSIKFCPYLHVNGMHFQNNFLIIFETNFFTSSKLSFQVKISKFFAVYLSLLGPLSRIC